MKLSDIELESYKGWWVVKDNRGNRKKATKSTFLFFLVESGVGLQKSKTDPIKLLYPSVFQRRFDFYYSQLDPDKSDLFALNMFPADEWEL